MGKKPVGSLWTEIIFIGGWCLEMYGGLSCAYRWVRLGEEVKDLTNRRLLADELPRESSTRLLLLLEHSLKKFSTTWLARVTLRTRLLTSLAWVLSRAATYWKQ